MLHHCDILKRRDSFQKKGLKEKKSYLCPNMGHNKVRWSEQDNKKFFGGRAFVQPKNLVWCDENEEETHNAAAHLLQYKCFEEEGRNRNDINLSLGQ